MSFVMFAGGLTSGGSRIRTLSVRSLLLGGGLAALVLMSAGAGLGYWISAPAPRMPVAQERPQAALTTPAFALEQLGALSGRLFKLESQASQLSERFSAHPAAPSKDALPPARKPGSGGPILPPRPTNDALEAFGALEARFARIEQQIALVSDASARQTLELMRWPSRLPIEDAELTSTFGNREDPITGRRAFHSGLDFAAETGTEIHAAAGGMVVFAGFRSDYGWMVEIEHGNGLTTRYAHASRLLVKPSAVVAPGEVIAMVGATGRSTGPHLHFEVLRNGEHTDPRRYLAGL